VLTGLDQYMRLGQARERDTDPEPRHTIARPEPGSSHGRVDHSIPSGPFPVPRVGNWVSTSLHRDSAYPWGSASPEPGPSLPGAKNAFPFSDRLLPINPSPLFQSNHSSIPAPSSQCCSPSLSLSFRSWPSRSLPLQLLLPPPRPPTTVTFLPAGSPLPTPSSWTTSTPSES
jgi:hypothetical protein